MTNQLIKLIENDGEQAVSASELHQFLVQDAKGGQKGEMFSHWIKRNLEYIGAEEGSDYSTIEYDYQGNVIAKNSKSDNQSVRVYKRDYALAIGPAKEISMIQNNDKGREARKYFIQCEKAALQIHSRILNRKELAQLVIDAENANEELQNKLAIQEPKVIFANAVSTSKTCILIGELAKILKQNGIDMGQNRLFEWLRSNGFLISRKGTDYNMPTQRSMDQSLFEIKETSIAHSDGHTTINKTPKVTGKGQVYFVNKFLSN